MKKQLILVQETDDVDLTRVNDKFTNALAHTVKQYTNAMTVIKQVRNAIAKINPKLSIQTALTECDGDIEIVFWRGMLRASIIASEETANLATVSLSKPVCEGDWCANCFAVANRVGIASAVVMVVKFLNCRKDKDASKFLADVNQSASKKKTK